MFGGVDFYFGITRKMVSVFGAIFSDLSIKRVDLNGNETGFIRVPLMYSAKDKMITIIHSDPELDRPFSTALPRMSFEIVDIVPDRSRSLPVLERRVREITPKDPNNLQFQYVAIPYDMKFALYIYAKNQEDAPKIVEQILPFFRPDWTPQIQLIPEMNETRDIPFIFDNLSISDDDYGDPAKRRILTYQLNFTCKTYFYGPVVKKPIIKFVDIKFDLGVPPTANVDIEADEHTTLQPGLLANGQPTANVSQSVNYMTINISDDYGYAFVDTENV
jgi:T4-like virus Myoviridae tail sheath stabiliser